MSRASISCSSMWIDVSTSSFTRRSEMTIASSKLWPFHGMNATSRFLPSASSPWCVDGPSARTSPFFTWSPASTTGFWLMHVPWFDRRNLCSRWTFLPSFLYSTVTVSPETSITVPSSSASSTSPASRAARPSTPVPMYGAVARSSGTACRCMLAPMSARLASSCSRNGMSDVATDTSCFGETSMYSTSVAVDEADLTATEPREHLVVEEVALLVDARRSPARCGRCLRRRRRGTRSRR